MQLYKGKQLPLRKEDYEIDLLMLLMETLSEVHVFIIKVKRKIAQTGWTNKGKDKTIPS